MGNTAGVEASSGEVDHHHTDGDETQHPQNYFDKIFQRSHKENEEAKAEKKKPGCLAICAKILYVVLGILTVVLSIAMIATTVTTGLATRIYSSELSGRLVAMIILAVTAAITLCVTIYSSVAIFRKKTHPVHVASASLVIIAVIQAIICGVSVRVTLSDEFNLVRSLTDSFHLAKEDSPRHHRIWATTQADLSCCGVYGPEDYRTPRLPSYFAPDIPISCCPSYDANRSELVQERAREVCKSRREFYNIGCKSLIVDLFKGTATIILSICITLIVLEVLEAILGTVISWKQDKHDGESKLRQSEEGAPEKPRRHKEEHADTKTKHNVAKIKISDEASDTKTKSAGATKASY